ncbi:MAG: serine hydrolase [Cyclobacteriaceae bacterium]|nr:serine hydrolase [Cyclobacteriaceae bacterium]
MNWIRFTSLVFVFFALKAFSQQAPAPVFSADSEKEAHWVDSVMSGLSVRDKIAQMVVIRALSDQGADYEDSLVQMVEKYKVGGITFFQGEVESQVRFTNRLQQASSIPIMISIDAEWGLGMRLRNTMSFPYQMALGAVQDNEIIYQMGREIARQSRRIGIHMNFAPVADVNNNAENPVINYRSFGEEKENVSKKSIAYMKGMQDHGVLASAKHFPGHGDTNVDSHQALPVILHDKARLQSLELYPFKQIIEAGVASVMVAHLNIPAYGLNQNESSSLATEVANDLLKKELGFNGLVVTDALEMKGVAAYYKPEDLYKSAFNAGNDLLVLPLEVETLLSTLSGEVSRGRIKEAELNKRVRKILGYKYKLGLNNFQPLKEDHVISDLNTPEAILLNRQLAEKAITVLKNDHDMIPLKRLDTLRIATVSIGKDQDNTFNASFGKYTQVTHFTLEAKANQSAVNTVKQSLKEFNLVVIACHDNLPRPYNRQIYSEEVQSFMTDQLAHFGSNTLLVSFRNPYTLAKIDGLENAAVVLTSYYDSDDMEDLSAQILFGGLGARGKLPVSVNALFPAGTGIETLGGVRFKYTIPEELGIDSQALYERIASIVQEGLDSAAYPGCQVLIAKDGKQFFHQAYGFHDYEKERDVKLNDIYDYASLTKVTSALPAVMQLHDQGKFSLDDKLADYVPEMKGSNKADIDWRHILAHNGRLQSWIPYWQTTFKKSGKFKPKTLSTAYSEAYNFKLSENLYMHKDYRDKIYKAIRKSPLNEQTGYLYSGLAFYLLPRIVEEKTGEEFQSYIKSNIYHKLGAYTITYNPADHFPLERIIPTENDTFFRKMQIHGVVHDEGAAMMKGVSANAGLFSDANDLAKLMQMYLNMGEYGGERYISEHTLRKFTTCQFCEEDNRRGLGFDKPPITDKHLGTPAPDVSNQSFGHTGYTGTFAWSDPESGVLIVFFSNRVHPTRMNTKLYSMSIRPRIHQVVYDLMKE